MARRSWVLAGPIFLGLLTAGAGRVHAANQTTWAEPSTSAATGFTTLAAELHPGSVPQLSSLPGAAYTIYLDFGGFSFTGNWGSSTGKPGTLLPYANIDPNSSFNTTQQGRIRTIWARTAEKYTGMNVNVTTVDPAVTAQRADSDADRQLFYDQTPRLMHTVIAGDDDSNGFISGGGVSYVGTTRNSYDQPSFNNGAGRGWHTNFVYSGQLGGATALKNIAEASGHENGHGLTLIHQSDWTDTTKDREYSSNGGDANVAPLMGVSYNSRRGAWRIGTPSSASTATQNDVRALLNNNGGIGSLLDDGIGHTLANATSLLLDAAGRVSTPAADGWIVPRSSSNPQPIGSNNYTTDFFRFVTAGGELNVSINEGGQRLKASTLDPGGTLDSILQLVDATGTVLATVTDPDSQVSTLTTDLPAGSYYLQVLSAGGKQSSRGDSARYYDMGSYFLSGTVAVPEPAAVASLSLYATMILIRRRRAC